MLLLFTAIELSPGGSGYFTCAHVHNVNRVSELQDNFNGLNLRIRLPESLKLGSW